MALANPLADSVMASEAVVLALANSLADSVTVTEDLVALLTTFLPLGDRQRNSQ